MAKERRQFPRLDLSEDAYVVDLDGRNLGKVTAVGGGGMQIHAASSLALEQLQPGRKLRVTVVEPQKNVTHSLEVEVRYQHEGQVGVEFV